jgi:hypothetical protein
MKPIITLRAALGAILICVTSFAPLAASAAEIIVGQVAPFSGPLAPTGNYLRAKF